VGVTLVIFSPTRRFKRWKGESQQQPKTENMMRNYSKLLGALAATSAFAAGSAFAGTPVMTTTAPTQTAAACDAGFDGNIHIGYNTDYIFRGTDQGNDMVEAGLDLSKDFGGFSLSGGLWHASINDSVVGDYDELDLYAEASKDFGFATAYIGYIWYHYQGTDEIDDAQELYFGLSRDLGWGINASLTYYWDVETDNQGYTELGLEKSIEFTPCISLDLGSKLAYLVEEGDFSHWTTSAALNFKIKETFTISPYVAYSVELDGAEEYSGKNEHNYLFGGVKASVSF